MTRAYLASRYSRREEMLRCRDELAAVGVRVTSRWIEGTHQYGADAERAQLDLGEDEAMARRFAEEDIEDLRAADVVVSFTERPREPSNNRGGRHVEFGLALALGKRCVVVGWRENAFHWLPQVEFHAAWAEALAALTLGEGPA